jgi:hypothetical protein
MGENQSYRCVKCGGTATADADAPAPKCCDQPMQAQAPMDACTTTVSAEHSRMDVFDEPCDDGRAGIKED